MAPGTIAVMDDMRPVAQTCALGGVFVLVNAVGLPAFAVWGDDFWVVYALGGFLFLLGAGLLLQTVPRFVRRNTPFIVIGPDGFRCPGLANASVPWAAVEYATVVGIYGVITTSFVFKDGAPVPERDGTRANVKVRKRTVLIVGPAPRGMSLEEYGALLASGIESSWPVSRTP